MILHRMEEVKNKRDGPMLFAMLLTRLYNHILKTNPQAIVSLARFTSHERVMNPLDISRNPTKERGKRVASPSASSSSSSSSDDNEAPSFLENKGFTDPPYGRSVPCLGRSMDHQAKR
ncbi:hypothetical protein Tco_1216171 [Tanacetum coccineum]